MCEVVQSLGCEPIQGCVEVELIQGCVEDRRPEFGPGLGVEVEQVW